MITELNTRAAEPGKIVIAALAALFFVACTWASYVRWANFEYRTFDLAYYVQAIWQLVHGRFQVSVENVPLLGNHVEPIVFLFAPLFAVFRHPMLFVAVQNAALATMGPVGYSIARRLGFDVKQACLLSSALLLTPAGGYAALHEFHPETLTAPLLLLLYHARLSNSLFRHWLWFIAVLACKENMAPLLAAYCAVQCIVERKRGFAELRTWYLWPLSLALLWFLVCSRVITPALNSGNIDYLALYDRLGTSPADILWKAITQPHLIGRALVQSLANGNLVWALLFPFLCLPLLRPRWIVIAAPILLQHLLSWRSSEWMIYFHYATPLLPLFWIAVVETLAALRSRKSVSAFALRGPPWLIVTACVIAQIWLGPAATIASSPSNWFASQSDRTRKNAFISQIPPQASVVAPFPYLAHLAMREKLYSLHYILKGLKTLSRASYEPPPPTDFVLIDYLDSATFDAGAGYYHPAMKTVDDRIIPSSDRLLHDFLRRASWKAECRDELTLYRKLPPAVIRGERLPGATSIFQVGNHTELVSIGKSDADPNDQSVVIHLTWSFEEDRAVFPWMLLRLTNDKNADEILTKGLCAPEANKGTFDETWRVTSARRLAAGEYSVEAIFIDNSKRAWFEATGGGGAEATLLAKPVSLGRIRVAAKRATR